MGFAAAEIALHKFEAGAMTQQALKVFVFEHVQITLVADIDPVQAELGRLSAFA